jgi:dienelactone hydrolase
MLAGLIPQRHQAAQVDRDVVGLADVQRQGRAVEALAEQLAPLTFPANDCFADGQPSRREEGRMVVSWTMEAAGTGVVDSIPVIWRLPEQRRTDQAMALWLPALGMDKEGVAPFLEDLAAAGWVAISFDLWQHGQRGGESAEQIRNRVFGSYRRYKWPILGQTTVDALRVIDWAADELAADGAVVAGGISLGGDVAVSLAGIERRVTRVAAIAASPDWTSPGMHGFDDPDKLLPQGHADAYAQWFYNQLDPMTHLDRFTGGAAMAFECGGEDFHVPPEAALWFRDELAAAHSAAGHPGKATPVRVTVHPGLGHLDAVRSPELQRRCLEWFSG